MTGTTGSGKSTTLASMINHINSYRNCHLITIEDPIEFLHRDRKALSIRERWGRIPLRSQTPCEPPSVRTRTSSSWVKCATGDHRNRHARGRDRHLVFSTLHTLDATETINRIIAVFPIEHQGAIRLQLAGILKGIISQRLLSRADGKGRVPAVEVLISTARIRECIGEERRVREVRDAIAEGHISYGMQTFDQSLMGLFKKKLVTYETALAAASNPDDFALFVRGISGTSEGKWDMSA